MNNKSSRFKRTVVIVVSNDHIYVVCRRYQKRYQQISSIGSRFLCVCVCECVCSISQGEDDDDDDSN